MNWDLETTCNSMLDKIASSKSETVPTWLLERLTRNDSALEEKVNSFQNHPLSRSLMAYPYFFMPGNQPDQFQNAQIIVIHPRVVQMDYNVHPGGCSKGAHSIYVYLE